MAWLVAGCADEEDQSLRPDADIAVIVDNAAAPDGSVLDTSADLTPVDSAIAPVADAAIDTMPPGRALYVSPTGVDNNGGTMASPLKTITKAMEQAKAGDTIWLLDGVWDQTIEPKLGVTSGAPCVAGTGLKLPDGVTLQAVNPRQAVIRVEGNHSLCVSTGTVRNIHFDRPSGQYGHIEISGGTSLVEGCTFAGAFGCGGSGWEAAIYAANKAKVTVVGFGDQNVNDTAGCQFVTVRSESDVTLSKLKIINGTAAITSGSSALKVEDKSTLRLNEVTLTRVGTGSRGIGIGTGTVIIQGSTIAGFPGGAIGVRGSDSVITFDKSTISNNAMGVMIDGSATITATDTTFDSNGYAILQGSAAGADITLKNSRLINHTRDALGMTSNAKLSVDGGEISGSKEDGIRIASGMPATCRVSVRNLRLINNMGTGARLLCYAGSVIDLGTLASPGGNTITGNGAGANASGVHVTTPGTVTMAVGNIWTPSAQAANIEGKYVANGAGAKLDVTAGNASGANYLVLQGTLRLAENP